MTRSPGLSTSFGARFARGCGVLLVGALWVGVTSTTAADGALARPGDSVSPVVAPASLAADDPARALPRLEHQSAGLTGPAGQALHAQLAAVRGFLAPETPVGDAEADALALEEAGPTTEQNNVARAAAAAKETFALAGTLASAALDAPAGQARRLLTGAALLDDAARATLTAAGREIPTSGGVASALKVASGAAGAAAQEKALGTLSATLTPAFAQGLCTGENATTITEPAASASPSPTPSGTASDAAVAANEPVSGFPLFSADSATLIGAGADLLHEAGAAAGRLAYASEVVAARAKTASSVALAAQRGELTRALQSAQPAGCLPVVVTSAGPSAAFTGAEASETMLAARAALADKLLPAAVSVSGDARSALLTQWWLTRPAAG